MERNATKVKYGLLIAIAAIVLIFTTHQVKVSTEAVSATGSDAFRKMFYILAGLSSALLAFALLRKKLHVMKPELVFVVVSLVLGLSYSIMIPVTAAPDESYHLGFTYAIADNLMGWETSPELHDTEIVRTLEAESSLSSEGIVHGYYAAYFPRLTEKAADSSTVEVPYSNNTEVPHIVYFFGALGIALGRALGLGVVPTLMLGRFLNLLIYTLAGFFAIRLIPFAKELLFLVMTLPMTIQEANSFSCDSMILAMAFLMTALVFHLAYGSVEKLDRRIILELILIGVFSWILSCCKYGACFPICLLLLIVVLRRRKNDKRIGAIAGGILVFDFLAGFLPSIVKTFHSGAVINEALPNYSLGEVMAHPLQTFGLLGNTIHRYMDHYLFSAIGTSLGWYEINVPAHVGLLFLLCIVVLLMVETGLWTRFFTSERVILGVTVFLGAAFSVGGMLVGNTPAGSPVIEGVQGRYLLPFLMPLLLLLIPRKIVLPGEKTGEAIREELLTVWIFLHFLMVMCLFLRAY